MTNVMKQDHRIQSTPLVGSGVIDFVTHALRTLLGKAVRRKHLSADDSREINGAMSTSLLPVKAVWTPKGYINDVSNSGSAVTLNHSSQNPSTATLGGSGYGGTPDTGYAVGRTYE